MTLKIPSQAHGYPFKSDADGAYSFESIVNGVTHFEDTAVDGIKIEAGGKTWGHLINTQKAIGHNIPQLYIKDFPSACANCWGAPILVDNTTTNGDNRAIAIKMKDTSTVGALTVSGIEIDIESPPDRGSDSSGLYIIQRGGGNAMSVYHHSTTFPDNGFAIEVGANGGSSAIFASAVEGKCLYGIMGGTTGAGIYMSSTADENLTRRAFKVSNAACSVEKFFVQLDGKVYAAGNVGIGVAPSAFMLDVGGDSMQLGTGGTGSNSASLSLNAGSDNASGAGIVGERNGSKVWSMGNANLAAATLLLDYKGGMNFRDLDDSAATTVSIDTNGRLGVGTTAPANPLAVNRSADGIIVDFESADTVEGNVSIADTTTSYNAFMGSHYTQLKDGQEVPPVGAIVIATGEIIPCEAHIEIPNEEETGMTIITKDVSGVERKEYFSYVELASQKADKRVYGVYHAKLSDDAKGQSFGEDDKAIHQIAALGLYKVRVTDTNGDIDAGDYIQSSIRAGECEKQENDILHNYTVAKSIIDVNFSEIEMDLKLGYKWQLIPATLHSG